MNTSAEQRVSKRIKVAYAAPAFALAVVGIPVYVYIPKFYTDVIGMEIGILGIILFSVRIFDALTDPAFGFVSDRTSTAFGRRRPYIAIGSVLVAASMYLLFNPPAMSPTLTTIYFAVWIYALFLFWTAVTVPYESLGPEITFDYDERTALFGLRDGFLIAGTLAAASSPAVIQWLFDLPDTPQGQKNQFFWIAVIYAPLVVGTCWWCVHAVKEVQRKSGSSTGLFKGVRHVFRNKPFVILLISYTIAAIGSNLPATLILYYVEYVLKSKLADMFLLIYFVTGIVFLPGWVWLSGKVGKKRAWLGSMLVNTGAFVGVFFLGPGDEAVYGILVFISGIGFGATLAIPSAIQADVIDYDELLTGDRREGQYVGWWSIAKKMAAAVGVGAGLAVLGWAGYEPNVEQSDRVVFALRTLYAGIPSLCNILAFVIALAYPISGEVHRDIRSAIDARKQGKSFSDPLRPARATA